MYYASSASPLSYVGIVLFVVIPLVIIAIVVPCKVAKARRLTRITEGSRKAVLEADSYVASMLGVRGFTVSRMVTNEWASLFVDDVRKQWCLREAVACEPKIFDFSDLLDFDLNEDGYSVAKGGGVGIGVGIAGPIGVGIGSGSSTVSGVCTTMEVRIRVSDIIRPEIVIPIWRGRVDRRTPAYKLMFEKSREFIAVLSYIIANAAPAEQSYAPLPVSTPDPAFCQQCGRALAAGARFCAGCGAKLN